MKDQLGLVGEVCVVTGAASGIGRSIARTLAVAGASVSLLDLNYDGAVETLEMVRSDGGSGIAIPCNIASEPSVEEARQATLEQLGNVGVLVNCAAAFAMGALESFSLTEWNRVFSVNVGGYFLCSTMFGRGMLAQGRGSIVHISSLGSETVVPNMGPYSPSKAAVTMLSNQIAVEWGSRGVRSNAVHPGMIHTPATQAAYRDEEVREKRAAAIPTGRIGEPDDVARAVLFLASPLSAYVNGSVLRVDGGLGLSLLAQMPRLPAQQPAVTKRD